jgi:hypothetical protein
MKSEVTIVVCYQQGTGDILATCLASLARHTKDVSHKVVVLTRGREPDADLEQLRVAYANVSAISLPEIDDKVSSRVHGAMLDVVVPSRIDTEYVLTLDSDCFPVANGWLSDLLKMLKDGARISGILHPWAPPPSSMSQKKLEWRVRSQHCWETTHVACQMLRTEDVRLLNEKYNTGDDTGLALTKKAKSLGWKTDGFKVTRCPKPETGETDPEFNRYVALVYGDRVYHHGGFTRTVVLGDEPVFRKEFGWVAGRVIIERGAEFLLDDSLSYRFEFDREEEVAKEKMQRLFGLKSQRMS